MSAPTVAVTCTAFNQGGPAIAGARFVAKLDRTEMYQGFIVPKQVEGVADASGVCVLQLWPNALGVAGSLYEITATSPDSGKPFLKKVTVAVPNSPCNLHEILVQEPYPPVDASQQALIGAQGYAASAQADKNQTGLDRIQIGEDRQAVSESTALVIDLTEGFGDVVAVVAHVDGQAGIATTGGNTATTQAALAVAAKDVAELARDAAMVTGKVYATTAAGLAATTTTQYFSVLSADSAELLILYENVAGVATERKRYPSSIGVTARLRTSVERPNLFSRDELLFRDKSRITQAVAAGYVTTGVSGGLGYWNIAAPGNGVTSEVRWRFARELFEASGLISASANILLMDASTGAAVNGGVFRIWQTNAAGGTISSSSLTFSGAGAIASPTPLQLDAVALDAAAVFVEFGFSVNSGAGQPARNLRFRDMVLTANPSSGFSHPPAADIAGNLFPDPAFSGAFATVIGGKGAAESGEPVLVMNTGALSQSLWSLPAVGALAPGAFITLGVDALVDAAAGNSVTVIFYNSAAAEISRLQKVNSSVSSYERITLALKVPAAAARIDLRLLRQAAAGVCKFRRASLGSDAFSASQAPLPLLTSHAWSCIHIDAAAVDDTGLGTETSPVKTFSRAASLSGQFARWIVAEGDYFEAPQLTPRTAALEVFAQRNARVRLIGGVQVAGATKTAGQAKIWQIALATKPLGKFLYQHDVPEAGTLIDIAERHSIHEGRSHRLPMTRIWEDISIAAIDAASRPAWFWSAGVLYFSIAGGGDPTAQNVRYIDGSTPGLMAPFYGAGTSSSQTLQLTGLQSLYWLHGFRTWDFAKVGLIRCRAFGNASNGIEHSDCVHVTVTQCEAGGNGNDGAGGHIYRANANAVQPTYCGAGNWYHDNYDDGHSVHEYWVGSEVGGLLEYNGDRGVATAVGAHTVHHDTLARKNGQGAVNGYAIDDGAGFACVGTAVDGSGVGTSMELHGCRAEGNVVNYNCAGSALNTLTGTRCESVNPVSVHYSASDGLIRLRSSTSAGAGTAKQMLGTGQIVVDNAALVV